jgi:hypothetical protein
MVPMKCLVCLNKTELDEGGVCGRFARPADIVRKNLDGVAKSKLKPSKRIVKCETCGTPMKPVLFRPEGPWTHYCAKGCQWCLGCDKIVRFLRPAPAGRARIAGLHGRFLTESAARCVVRGRKTLQWFSEKRRGNAVGLHPTTGCLLRVANSDRDAQY